MEDQEIINEFLIESTENLARLDEELVVLERQPKDAELLASVFRTFHTIKGTCGFLSFGKLERITHIAESILSQLRNGERELTPGLISLLLDTVDAVKAVLKSIEANGDEGEQDYGELCARLQQAGDAAGTAGAGVEPACLAGAAAQVAGAPAEAPVETSAEASKDPAGESAVEAAAAVAKGPSIADSTIRVDVGLLDKLMNLVGELVLARNQILQFNARQEDAAFNANSQRLNLITSELQESVMKTRMQPIGMVWNKLPRLVRDVAASCHKQIALDMDGAETEIDRTILEAIKDPLTHMVRNCCDHGIEAPAERRRLGKPAEGKLSLRAFHEGGHVNIEVNDDGAGIDPERIKSKAVQKGLVRPEQAERLSDREALQLVFLPGFSTAEQVTSISGRGVGMDVVKTNIERIGGVVDLTSVPGQGTSVKIKIPLTLAIIPGLVVTSGGERFVIPQVSLLELVRLEGETGLRQIERIHQTPVYRRRGSLLPIAYLNEVLGVGGQGSAEVVNIVVLQAEDRQFGLVVDGISDTQEIVVKPLGKQLKGLTCYAGATIMGDGKVALILDVLGVAQRSGVMGEHRETQRTEESGGLKRAAERQSLLLFQSGSFERLAVPLSMVARLEEFPRTRVEQAAGRLVVQYRGRILPLVPLAERLEGRKAGNADPLQVIVFGQGERTTGVMVDRILDIVEEDLSTVRRTRRPGLLGSAVVGNRVTDLLDLESVMGGAEEDWPQGLVTLGRELDRGGQPAERELAPAGERS